MVDRRVDAYLTMLLEYDGDLNRTGVYIPTRLPISIACTMINQLNAVGHWAIGLMSCLISTWHYGQVQTHVQSCCDQ